MSEKAVTWKSILRCKLFGHCLDYEKLQYLVIDGTPGSEIAGRFNVCMSCGAPHVVWRRKFWRATTEAGIL